MQSSLAPNQLPEFLSIDDGGFIHVTGRRVGLHHILRAYNEGLSCEEIALEYPSLDLAVVHKTIAFALEHRADVDQYVAKQDRIVGEQMAASRPGPTVAELRARLIQRQAPVEPQQNKAG
jgi:uncharacterized protein (DUF433 family)